MWPFCFSARINFFQIYIWHIGISGCKLQDLSHRQRQWWLVWGGYDLPCDGHSCFQLTLKQVLRTVRKPIPDQNFSWTQKPPALLLKNILEGQKGLLGSEDVLLEQEIFHVEGGMDILMGLWASHAGAGTPLRDCSGGNTLEGQWLIISLSGFWWRECNPWQKERK